MATGKNTFGSNIAKAKRAGKTQKEAVSTAIKTASRPMPSRGGRTAKNKASRGMK
jgi:hypothetical protein